jgi:hypothetical protein
MNVEDLIGLVLIGAVVFFIVQKPVVGIQPPGMNCCSYVNASGQTVICPQGQVVALFSGQPKCVGAAPSANWSSLPGVIVG